MTAVQHAINAYCPYLDSSHNVLAVFGQYYIAGDDEPKYKFLHINCDLSKKCTVQRCPMKDKAIMLAEYII